MPAIAVSSSRLGALSPLPARPRPPAAAPVPADTVELPTAPPPSPTDLAEMKANSKTPWGRRIAQAAAYGVLAGTGATATATVALVNPAALGPIGPPLNKVIVDSLPEGVQSGYHWAMDPNPRQEAPSQWGQLYMISPDQPRGEYQVLADNGQTSARGDDIPAEAVVDGRVVIGFEGIQGSQGSYSRAMDDLFFGENPAADLDQNMLWIHQGQRARGLDDITRVLADYQDLKDIQAGRPFSSEEIFRTDPAVETGYNVIRQALDQDLDIVILAHSGGGVESVEALNLLAAHGYRDDISEHVKIMIMAGAASAQDAVQAGVQPDNALYIGMKQDVVAQLGHVYVDPHHPLPGIREIIDSVGQAEDFALGPWHSPDRAIVPRNLDHVQDFFERGVGGTYLAE